jgi:hypothetical protein
MGGPVSSSLAGQDINKKVSPVANGRQLIHQHRVVLLVVGHHEKRELEKDLIA